MTKGQEIVNAWQNNRLMASEVAARIDAAIAEERDKSAAEWVRATSTIEGWEEIIDACTREAIAEEREACAKLVEAASQRPGSVAEEIAAAIRARKETTR